MLAWFKNLFSKESSFGSEIIATAHVMSLRDGNAVMVISGAWNVSDRRTGINRISRELAGGVSHLSFDTTGLKSYDSSLVSLLFKCYELCKQSNISFDIDSLPKGLKALLSLAVAVPEAESAKKTQYPQSLISDLGKRTIGAFKAFTVQSGFVGEVTLAFIAAAFNRARFRISDLLGIIQRAGPEALPIVALISFLVGLILAFVGAIQLAKYGSEIFVADLVGIAMVREMGAMMVGIVMSGRTGAAFAAELGSMKVNEEISAFKTFGISPIEFLVFPRVIGLIMMFPLLTVFADVVGMIGGMVIGIGMFDLSYEQYANRTLAALTLTQISTGIGKSFVFGAIVACIGCQKGLSAETSSSGVGQATTASVVQSITWIIVADAIFAVAFTIFDI